MFLALYDRDGAAIVYSDDGEHLFLFSGQPAAYIDADAVFSYRGEQLGWFERGWLRDKDGRCVAFSEKAAAGPHVPARGPLPPIAPKQPLPTLERQDPRALRPLHSNTWSNRSAIEFFARSPLRWPGNLGKPPDTIKRR